MKIGITLTLKEKNQHIFTNGVFLNILYMQRMLRQMGYEAYILDTGKALDEPYEGKVNWDINEFPTYDFVKNFKKMNFLMLMGAAVQDSVLKEFKNVDSKNKVVQYKCGNDYVIDMERILHNSDPKNGGPAWNKLIDQVWYVPQQQYQNHDYYKAVYDLGDEDVFPVPFIWDSYFLDKLTNEHTYVPKKQKNLCSIEPNLNVVKYAMVPMLIAEQGYKKGLEFNKMHVFSGSKFLNTNYSKSQNGVLSKLSMVHEAREKEGDPKLKFLKKFQITDVLKTNDVVISHQWCNPLNYAYLDVLYFNHPLIHNSPYIKDAGYYYPDFKIIEGYNKLNYVISYHDEKKTMNSYTKNAQKVLSRYSIHNKRVQESYYNLIEDLMQNRKKERFYSVNKNIIQ